MKYSGVWVGPAQEQVRSQASGPHPNFLAWLKMKNKLWPLGRVVTDLQETTDSLTLDADNGDRLQSRTGQLATRDIVQFVPMRGA
ncbi:hypothetical protein C5167_012013 [Papaver somniferum]|uniref:Uncharacterized protein n=1 Tax=Papaver somniferum TaxID=3469 RepID=A0A4Y7J0H4_PAPSO|nr:hypothetical protein C5167_012013 [Papaver somniferum]